MRQRAWRWSAWALMGLALPAWADNLYHFAVAAKPLPQALSDFSRITGQSIVYTDEQPYRLQAPALFGDLSAAQALQRLLAGSGLGWRQLDQSTVTLQVLDTGDALSLTATTVSSQRDAPGSYQSSSASSVLRSTSSLHETPQTINVVTQQMLVDQAPRNLDDALVNVSGITQGNTLGSTQDTLMKRGFGDNRDGSIIRDGMPMVQGRNLNATAERIEVMKGPASLLYGIQDPGGIINVVSKRPQLTPYNALQWRGSSYAAGKNGSGGGLDSSGPLGDTGLAYRLVLDHDDEAYWRNFGTHRETLVAPSLAWLGEHTQVLLAIEHREFLYPFDRGTAIDPRTNHPLDIPATRRLDEPFNNMRGRSDFLRLEWDHEFNDQWKAHLGYGDNRETYNASQVRVTAVNPTTGTLTRSMDGTGGALSRDRFTTLSLNGSVDGPGGRHDLLIGVDDEYRKIYRADLIRQASRTTFSYLDPVYDREVEGTSVSASDSQQRDELRSDSLFVQDALHLNDQWTLVAGTRLQRYDQEAGKGIAFKVNTNLHDQAWIPRAGLVYAFSPQLSLYASYTESLKPNSTIAPLLGNVVVDSAIEPERAKSWELGLRLDGEGLSGNLALYDIHKRNVLVANYDAVSTNAVYSNAGQVRSQGLEADLTGELDAHWSLMGNYAFTDALVTRDPVLQGNRLQNVARQTGAVFVVRNVDLPWGGDRLRLGVGAHYVGARAGNAANDFELPAYTVFDAFATYDTQLDEHRLKLQLNVKNLFNRVYYTSSVNRYFVSMGDARQLMLSGTLEF